MSNHYTHWERYFQKLNIIFNGVIAVSMIPFAWAFLETQRDFASPPLISGDGALMIKFGLVGLALLILLISFRYHRRSVGVHSSDALIDKLKEYYKKNLRFYAMIEGAAILAFVGLFLLKDHFFSFLYVVVLFVFSQTRPTYDRVVKQLNLSEEEVEDLNQLSDS